MQLVLWGSLNACSSVIKIEELRGRFNTHKKVMCEANYAFLSRVDTKHDLHSSGASSFDTKSMYRRDVSPCGTIWAWGTAHCSSAFWTLQRNLAHWEFKNLNIGKEMHCSTNQGLCFGRWRVYDAISAWSLKLTLRRIWSFSSGTLYLSFFHHDNKGKSHDPRHEDMPRPWNQILKIDWQKMGILFLGLLFSQSSLKTSQITISKVEKARPR